MTKLKITFALVFITLMSTGFSEIGREIDSFNHVKVYYNGSINNVEGRHLSSTGYNFGLKWQCVEFVKRYYYQVYHHEFPNGYGHAKDFFDTRIKNFGYNKKRGLYQYYNSRTIPPRVGDILVFKGNTYNPYGHICIISAVGENYIEVVQQNCDLESRRTISYIYYKGNHIIEDPEILGGLRMTPS